MKTTQILVYLNFFLFVFGRTYAQSDVVKVVKLDEFVVNAGLENFDVADFIDQVKNDTTFYQAFLNLTYFPHQIQGAVVVFEKDETERGTMQRRAVQHLDDSENREVEITFEKTNGKIKNRKGEWKYLTAEMYDDVFFPTEKSKVSNRIGNLDQELVSGSSIEKHKAQLKRMMFNPGAEIENVPLIGDKMAIFDDEMVPYYNYNIFMATWQDTIPCIAFSCFAKAETEDETVIKDLTSYFHIDSREVIAREYRLAHETILFDFDIRMKVENIRQDGWLLPQKIWYSGYWDAVFKKPEIISFELENSEYQTRVGKYR